jgi:hypothetical protein
MPESVSKSWNSYLAAREANDRPTAAGHLYDVLKYYRDTQQHLPPEVEEAYAQEVEYDFTDAGPAKIVAMLESIAAEEKVAA